MIDITPKYIIIPLSESVFLEDDGLGATIGGLGGKLVTDVEESVNKTDNAINSDYDVITDLINARLDTSAKTILGDFTFGASGALQIGTYSAGVSGDVKISPAGILARDKDNATTIAIDGTTGNVTMSGTITAIAGSIGGWEISPTAIYYDGATDAVSAGMASADYPFYAGKKYADRATAPFRVTPAGALVATSATITGNFTINNPGDIDQTSLSNSAAAGATVGADWSSNLANVPSTLGSPSGTGLFLSSSYMGYYTDSAWATYIKSDGTFYFKGDDDNYVYWNGSALNVRGTLNATDINAGTLSVDRISAGSIVSSKVGTDLTDSNISSINFNNITATNVVADSVSANDITAGTMTGSTVRTDTGGAGHYKRVEMSNSDNSLKFYNSDNVLTGSIYGNVTSSDLLWINADTLWIQAPTIINDTLGVGGVTAGTIVPNSTTGSYDLGDSTHKWGELHCKDFFTTSNEANWTGDIVPTTDNLYELGLSTSTRWYKLWSHYTAVGDLLMANGFRINEESEDAIAIYNQKDEKIFILDEDGDLWIKGKVRSNTDMKKDFPFNLKVYTKKELKNKEDEKTDWKTNTKMSITKKNLLKVTKK